MASITLKSLSPSVHRALKARAKRHKRSLNQEVLAVLEQSVAAQPKVDIEAMLERERRFSESLGFTTTPEEIEAAIQEGRRI
jgi:plasmid stability protein